MKIGLIDVDSLNFPNLALMKISAYHKSVGDTVEWFFPFSHYDKVYVSKIFGNEYSHFDESIIIQADEIIYGGTGFAISIQDEKETYTKQYDKELNFEVEHIYPDYSLYHKLTQNTAYGFLTRGCPRNCPFCIVSGKEGRHSNKVADLSEFRAKQHFVKLLDPNLLACKECENLLQQLVDSKAQIDFTQGLDARLITKDIAELLKQIKTKRVHFAFDLMENEQAVIKGLETYSKIVGGCDSTRIVYILTNYNTTTEEDIYRVKKVQELGYLPDVRIYRKENAPQITKDLQRWCNNRIIYRSTSFLDYIPRKDGKTIKQLYFER